MSTLTLGKSLRTRMAEAKLPPLTRKQEFDLVTDPTLAINSIDDLSIDDLLGDVAVKPKKGKADKPKVQSNETIDQLAKEYLKYAEEAKSADKMAKIRRDDVVALAKPMFYEACGKAGKSLSSVNVGIVSMTVTNNYSAIDLDEKNNLMEAFGEDFDRYFRTDTEVSLKKESANDNAFLQELIARVGVPFFKEHFESKRVLKVNGCLHDAINTDPVVRAQVQPLLGSVIKPYAPSLKLS